MSKSNAINERRAAADAAAQDPAQWRDAHTAIHGMPVSIEVHQGSFSGTFWTCTCGETYLEAAQ